MKKFLLIVLVCIQILSCNTQAEKRTQAKKDRNFWIGLYFLVFYKDCPMPNVTQIKKGESVTVTNLPFYYRACSDTGGYTVEITPLNGQNVAYQIYECSVVQATTNNVGNGLVESYSHFGRCSHSTDYYDSAINYAGTGSIKIEVK